MESTDQARIAYFDYLRIFAIFLIMLLHTASLCWYDTDVNSLPWFILNIFKVLTDHAVLLFVMISGSLFLRRDIPFKTLFNKYILRMICAFIVWSFVYALISNYMWGIRSVLIVTLTSHYHLWFLPMIAGLYLAQPILRLFVRSPKAVRYFLLLSFVFSFLIPQILNLVSDFGGEGVLGIISAVNDRLDELGVHLVTGYSFYYILGYYIHNKELDKKSRSIIYILGVCGFILTGVLSTVHAAYLGTAVDTYHENFNIGVMLSAFATFVFFKYNTGKQSSSSVYSRFIRALSQYSFGAYLIHALVIEQLAERLGLNAVSFFPAISVPVIGIITFIISFAVSALLNQIPFIKRYIV